MPTSRANPNREVCRQTRVQRRHHRDGKDVRRATRYCSKTLVVALGCLVGACEQRPTPTGPTPIAQPTARYDIRPAEPQLRDWFWREFAFDGRTGANVTRALATTDPNLYIRMGDPTGRRVVSYGHRDHMRRAFPPPGRTDHRKTVARRDPRGHRRLAGAGLDHRRVRDRGGRTERRARRMRSSPDRRGPRLHLDRASGSRQQVVRRRTGLPVHLRPRSRARSGAVPRVRARCRNAPARDALADVHVRRDLPRTAAVRSRARPTVLRVAVQERLPATAVGTAPARG